MKYYVFKASLIADKFISEIKHRFQKREVGCDTSLLMTFQPDFRNYSRYWNWNNRKFYCPTHQELTKFKELCKRDDGIRYNDSFYVDYGARIGDIRKVEFRELDRGDLLRGFFFMTEDQQCDFMGFREN